MTDAAALNKGPRIRFENTLNWGHVLTFTGLILGGLLAFSAVREAVSNIDTRLLQAEQTISAIRSDMAAIIPSLAVSQQRIDTLEGIATTTNAVLDRMAGQLTNIQVDLSALRARQSSGTPP